MTENLNARKIYNDVVDEEIDLENPEDVPGQMERFKNQPVDEAHALSDNSEVDVPSPEDEEGMATGARPKAKDMQNVGGLTQGTASAEKALWIGYNPADYKNLNISPEIKDLFKHITKYCWPNPQLRA